MFRLFCPVFCYLLCAIITFPTASLRLQKNYFMSKMPPVFASKTPKKPQNDACFHFVFLHPRYATLYFCFYTLPPVNIPYIFGNNLLDIIPKINDIITPNNIIKIYQNNIKIPFSGIILIYIFSNSEIIMP